MEIKIGKYTLKSDGFCMWIDEEYEIKTGKTKGKKGVRRIAGYASNLDNLIRQFIDHRHKASEATTVAELLKEMQQMAEDAELIRKTALKEDFKLMRATAKKVKEINK